MIAAETVVGKKLKIKFSTKRIEYVPGIRECESGRNVDKNYHSQACDMQNTKLKPVVPGANKRGPLWEVEGRPEKKRKMGRCVTHQCFSILKSLINNPSGWIFREPVDPVALKIPDYFSIISNPMDLGTIKSKLEKNQYSGTEEFAADVRLTFSNAMLYNPPTNYVHQVAESLNKIFETKWKSLQQKWNHEISESGGGKILSRKPKEISATRQNCPETSRLRNVLLPKMSKPSEYKAMRSSSNAKAAEVKLFKPAENCMHKALLLNSCKGTSGGKCACCPVSVKPSSPVVSECVTSVRSAFQCCLPSDSTHASSDISSERSLSRDDTACGTDASKLDYHGKSMSASQMSKSDPDSDGAVSTLDDENAYPSLQLITPATDATSREGWRPTCDVQLSPAKALRAAMLKYRFADTILKAQHKTLLDHTFSCYQGDKADPVKMQQEKERLERRQREEKASIEAQMRAAEAASQKREELELKIHREKEREAARVALQKMGKTVNIEQNLEILKELEILSGGSLSYNFRIGAYSRSPLERLGLFIKDDIWDEDEMVLNGEEEEGEIFP
ncbi:hypothetical protein P3X46_033070 [Hevea brasiliensis]|uniref:Bromo domain-containing protein n=1 Tax=Hevea brasiliensis TaxID=3981 RepID=A0ABQ9KFA2_HEVBR|nr:transcription factor GTE12 isoform X1 [Hevea brasiliensis]XP_057996688.1 transcription factor GTE12 isoform X1 [Hevea brasiliensis]KAJ9135952.1 hypothetical protein P3X46_033070 [Hevea brasiliensis]